MKNLLIVILVIAYPSLALSHPGKTDRRGGHKCWKDCSEWQLDYGEYHLHDKDFRPIRPNREENPSNIEEPAGLEEKVPAPEGSRTAASAGGSLHVKRLQEPAQSKGSYSPLYEEGILSLDGYQLALSAALIFLLVCLLTVRSRRA